MAENNNEFNKDDFNRLKESHISALDILFAKVKKLVYKMKEISDENVMFKENIRELNNNITELKLQLTKNNSDSVIKDKEISDLKNTLLDSSKDENIIQDKENVKSRIKELISRIDVHLDKDGDEDEYDS
jgi:transcriptional regulator with AAA-type ATPase domain